MSESIQPRIDKIFGSFAVYVRENHFKTIVALLGILVFIYFESEDRLDQIDRMALQVQNWFPSQKWIAESVYWFLKNFPLKFISIFVIVLAVVTPSRMLRIGLLFALGVVAAVNVISAYYTVPNHGFMATYAILGVMIASFSKDNSSDIIRFIALYLLAILMGIALIQKLTSWYYLHGNLLGEYLVRGQIYQTRMEFIVEGWDQMTSANRQAMAKLMATPPSADVTAKLIVPAAAGIIITLLTVASLVSQFVVDAALILRKKIGIWLHVIILGFVVIIYSSRNENEFLSMNCFLGYCLTDEETKAARIFYVLWMIYLWGTNLMQVRPYFIL